MIKINQNTRQYTYKRWIYRHRSFAINKKTKIDTLVTLGILARHVVHCFD